MPFLKRFSAQKSNFDVNLFQIRQNPEETIENYLARVYQTTNEYDIPKHLLIGMTVQGLKSELRKIVMPQKPETLEQLREMAVIAERTVKSTESLSENFAVSLSNMEERLMSNLSDRFEATLAAVTNYNSQNFNRQKSFRGRRQFRPNNQTDRRNNFQFRNQRQDFHDNNNDNRNRRKCMGCGGNCVDRDHCIAKGQQCFNCKRMDHFASVCRSGRRGASQYPQ